MAKQERYIWIIWKHTEDDPVQIHAVCSTRELAAHGNIRAHKCGIKTWIGKYLVDHLVHWSVEDTDPIIVEQM